MLTTAVKLFLLCALLGGVSSADECLCLTEQNGPFSTPPWIWPATVNGMDPCIPESKICTTNYDSGDDTKGFSMTNLFFYPDNSGIYVEAFNNDGSSIWGKLYTSDYDNTTSSTTRRIQVVMNYTDVNPVLLTNKSTPAVYGQLFVTDLYVPPTTTTEPPPPPTPFYNGTLNPNPASLSSDIMFALDVGKGESAQVAATLNSLQDVMVKLTQYLWVTTEPTDSAPVDQSRLGLISLTPLAQMTLVNQPWKFTSESFDSAVRSLTPINFARSEYTTGIQAAIDNFFTIKNTKSSELASRPHAERLFVILAAGRPNDDDAQNFEDFLESPDRSKNNVFGNDVHILIIGYNLGTDALAYYNGLKNVIFKNIFDSNDNTINDLLANYVIGNKKKTACDGVNPMDRTKTQENTFTLSDSNQKETVQIPYQTIDMDPTSKKFDKTGQTGRYCNNMNTPFTFNQDKNGTICFDASYELENRADFLHFYSGSKLLISLTGQDIKHTVFEATAPIKVVFQSDNQGVYGGFNLVASNGECPDNNPPNLFLQY